VFADGKCTRESKEIAHVCKPDDVADCKEQCDKGNGQSCDHYGVLAARGKAPGVDAKALFEKACKGGSASGCGNLGIRQLAGNRAEGLATLEGACRDGDARSCGIVGAEFFPGRPGKKDEKKALALFTAGCNGGDMNSCLTLGLMYSGAAKSVPVDDKKALQLSARACNGGLPVACGNAGLRHEMGMGVPKNPMIAARLFERACSVAPAECFRIAILHQHGAGVPKSDDRAKDLFTRSCRFGMGGLQQMSCFLAAELYKEPTKVVNRGALAQTIGIMQPQCTSKVVRACSFMGAIQLAQNDKIRGTATLKKACIDQDAWACDLVKRLKL
jgi:TPR repeat protein